MTFLLNEITQQTERVFAGRVFQVEVQTVRLTDGRPARREIVRHGGGAGVVAIDEQQRVCLVRQYRKPMEAALLEIPAGKLEPGEEPAACAKRELAEETGLLASRIDWLAEIYPTPGYSSEVLSIYLATGLIQGDSRLDDGEHLNCLTIPLAEALVMIDRGEIRDAKTLVGLLTLSRRLSGSGLNMEGEIS
jgi:ADP-ribose pyrophosphatase